VFAESKTWLLRVGWRRAKVKLIWLDRWIAARHPDDFIGLAIAA